nr:glycoside hydrolase family 43 protein [Paenibacillus methanolicus]
MAIVTATFTNPIMSPGADPWVLRHDDGFYYFMVTQRDRLTLWRSRSLAGIADGEQRIIWQPEQPGPYSFNLWAPEIHRLNGRWYVYYTANDGGGDDTRRVCVLENEADNPLEGEWIWRGPLATERPGLDGSVLEHGGSLYFCYAGYGHFPDYGSALYLVRMTDPCTLAGPEALLTAPMLEWEKQGGMAINEGPVFLKRGGRVFLVYSASTTWSEDYALGLLTMAEASDPMTPGAWTKTQEPVFRKSAAAGVYATGHNSLTVSPDGAEDWIVYHALPEAGADTKLRSTFIQPFGWREDGTPDFGTPAGWGAALALPAGTE